MITRFSRFPVGTFLVYWTKEYRGKGYGRVNCLATLVPGFFRCFWCSGYFEVSKECTHRRSDFRCCLFCADNLEPAPPLNQKKWRHCPICYKFILVQSVRYFGCTQLDIHIQHRSEEQSLQCRHHDKNSTNRESDFSSWYPDSIDCERLFWYQHEIKS